MLKIILWIISGVLTLVLIIVSERQNRLLRKRYPGTTARSFWNSILMTFSQQEANIMRTDSELSRLATLNRLLGILLVLNAILLAVFKAAPSR